MLLPSLTLGEPIMRTARHENTTLRVVVMVMTACVCCASLAQGTSDRDTKEISAYKLTDAALAKYQKATTSLASIPAQPGECSDSDDSSNGQSLDQQVAKMNANPAVRSAIQSAGMTTREYLLFSWSMFQAGMAAWALNQPGAKPQPDLSMDNVAFYRKHEAALKQLGEQGKSRCGDDARDE
jgi:hypothetical protein